MTCNVTSTPWVEPLPLYSRDDPDAISIHSAAPSYVSDTPTYTTLPTQRHNNTTSSLLPPPSPDVQTPGLPAVRYAPGFQPRTPGSIQQLSIHSFNATGWGANSGVNTRQYQAVARRRANAAASTTAILSTLASSSTAVPSRDTSPTASSTNVSTGAYPTVAGSSTDTLSPLEDPYLVGEDAARRARAQRVYREMCLHEEETTRSEGRGWEFMVGQMVDWTEREQNWRHLRGRAGNTKLIARRLGLRN